MEDCLVYNISDLWYAIIGLLIGASPMIAFIIIYLNYKNKKRKLK